MGTVLNRMSKKVLRGRDRRNAIVKAGRDQTMAARAKYDRLLQDAVDRQMAKQHGGRKFKRTFAAVKRYMESIDSGVNVAVRDLISLNRAIQAVDPTLLRGVSELDSMHVHRVDEES